MTVLKLIEIDGLIVKVAEERLEAGGDTDDQLLTGLLADGVRVRDAPRQEHEAAGLGMKDVGPTRDAVVPGEHVEALVYVVADVEGDTVACGRRAANTVSRPAVALPSARTSPPAAGSAAPEPLDVQKPTAAGSDESFIRELDHRPAAAAALLIWR